MTSVDPTPAGMEAKAKIANALETSDWSDVSIGNKVIISAAIEALRSAETSAAVGGVGPCGSCMGAGMVDALGFYEDPCSTCGGTGELPIETPAPVELEERARELYAAELRKLGCDDLAKRLTGEIVFPVTKQMSAALDAIIAALSTVAAVEVASGDREQYLSEALFALSARIKAAGFLDDTANRAAYERVVKAFNMPVERAVGPVFTVRIGPCDHTWAYGPTTGEIVCIRCLEGRPHNHPDTKAYLAALNRRTDAGGAK